MAWSWRTSFCWPSGEPTLSLTPRASELAFAPASASASDPAPSLARLVTLVLLLLVMATLIRAHKLCSKLRRSEVTDSWSKGCNEDDDDEGESFVPSNWPLFFAVWGQLGNLCALSHRIEP